MYSSDELAKLMRNADRDVCRAEIQRETGELTWLPRDVKHEMIYIEGC